MDKRPPSLWLKQVLTLRFSVALMPRAKPPKPCGLADARLHSINIASLQSFNGGFTIPAYAASKGGVAQITKALANEWASSNVNVNAIAPGYIVTDLTWPLYVDPARSKEIQERLPAQRWGEPKDLKGSIVFLASPASDFVHGHTLVVDGGWMAR